MEEKAIVKRSIFKQETYTKIYGVINRKYDSYYSPYSPDEFKVDEIKNEKIKEEEIFTCELEMPLLQNGEEFYIEEKELLVKIIKSYRTSKENVVYYIEPLLIEDDKTALSKVEAEERLSKFNESNHKVDEYKTIIKQYENSFWSRFIGIKKMFSK